MRGECYLDQKISVAHRHRELTRGLGGGGGGGGRGGGGHQGSVKHSRHQVSDQSEERVRSIDQSEVSVIT